MIETIQQQRTRITCLKLELDLEQQRLHDLVKNCNHVWGDTEADHIRTEGYTIPGDPPGTMGIDWRGPLYVKATETKRWKRTCKTCGVVQHTSATTLEKIERPHFLD